MRQVLHKTAIFFFATTAAAFAQSPSAIDKTAFVPLGGIEQWINISGADRANPVLLVVHGGPGEAQWPQAEVFKPWEKDFTVVQWDQRGSGHTFGRYGTHTPDVTLGRISKDGVELAQYLCRELGKKKIIVLGHSWGTFVAIHMVQMRPDLFAAYVGTGQGVSWSAMVNTQFGLLLAKARRDGDQATVKELEAVGNPARLDGEHYFRLMNKHNFRSLWAPSDQAWLQHLRAQAPQLDASHPEDFKNLNDGMEFSGERVLPDQMAANLLKTACHIRTAFFVIEGEEDVLTPTQAAIDYFKRVKAPKKDLILVPNQGHFAWMTSPDKFLQLLTSKVRPVALKRGA